MSAARRARSMAGCGGGIDDAAVTQLAAIDRRGACATGNIAASRRRCGSVAACTARRRGRRRFRGGRCDHAGGGRGVVAAGTRDSRNRGRAPAHAISVRAGLSQFSRSTGVTGGVAPARSLPRLDRCPDLLVCDGHGLAHPRRIGLASHLGLVAGIPSIGAAKSMLIGRHAPVPARRGAWRPIVDDGEVVGAALRTRAGCKPMYVSVGHGVSLAGAISYVLTLSPRYRLPETTRAAHRLASQRPVKAKSATRRHRGGAPAGS